MSSNDPFGSIVIPGQQAEQPSNPATTTAGNDPFGSIQVPSTSNSSSSGSFMTAVDNMNRAFGRMAEGTMQKGAQALNYMGLDTQPFQNQLAAYSKNLDQQAAQESAVHPIAGAIGNIAGSLGAATAYGGGLAGGAKTLIGKMAINAGLAGLQSYLNYTPDGESALKNAGMGALTAGVMTPVLGGVGKISGFLSHALTPDEGYLSVLNKVLNPKAAALNNLATDVGLQGGLDTLAQKGAAAESLGVNLSPGELLGKGPTWQNELSIPNNAANAEAMLNHINDQTNKLQPMAQGLIDNLVPGGDANAAKQTVSQMYNNYKDVNISPEVLEQLKQNPDIANRLAGINMNPRSLAKELPDTSLSKLDLIKQDIDNDLYNNAVNPLSNNPYSGIAQQPLDSDTKNFLYKTRNDLVNTLDQETANQNVPYADTRKVAQGLILQNNIKSLLNNVDAGAGNKTGNLSLDQMYNTLWNTPEKQEYMLNAIKDTGGDTSVAKNIMETIGDVRNSPMKQITGNAPKDSSFGSIGNSNSLIERVMKHFTEGQYNDELTKLYTDPSWQAKIKPILEQQQTPSDKMTAIGSFLQQMKQSDDIQKLKEALQNSAPVALGNAQAQGSPVLQNTLGILHVLSHHGYLPHIGEKE